MSICLTINGKTVEAEKGQTILQTARKHDIYIPTLCDYPGLPPHGSCRMCIVEVHGRSVTPTACTTPVEEGMLVQTDTPKIRELRLELLRMLLSEHPGGCLFCPENQHCEECMITLRKARATTGCRSCSKDGQCVLQEMAQRFGLDGVAYPVRYRGLPVEKFDPFFDRDYNLCILCGRCVRVCEESHFESSLAFTRRGTHALVGTAFHRTHIEAGCSFCGACVEACPTGTLAEKTRKWDGKPDAEILSTCPLCSLSCSLRLLTKEGMVIGSLPGEEGGALCVKGRFGIPELVNGPSRLTHPSRREEDESLACTWEEALDLAAKKLLACPPERFELVIAPECSNEDLYLADKFIRSTMKNAAVRTTAQERYGAGMGAVYQLLEKSSPLEALDTADVVLCLGVDAKYAQSVVETRLHKARKRGARLITLNAREHGLARGADIWLRPTQGSELSLIEMLAGQITAPQRSDGKLDETAALLREAAHPLILVGPDFLTHPCNQELLAVVEDLSNRLGAGLVVLAEQGNLVGSMRVGFPRGETPTPGAEVLYLIGAPIPQGLPETTFVIYQNLYPPAGERLPDLTLPMAAFTEIDGTLTDSAGREYGLSAAVPPPGASLPGWEILSRLARAMGATGFNHANVDDVRMEMTGSLEIAREFTVVANREGFPRMAVMGEHQHMGFALADYVAGLRKLYPLERGDESHD